MTVLTAPITQTARPAMFGALRSLAADGDTQYISAPGGISMSEYSHWKDYYSSWSSSDLLDERERIEEWIRDLESVPMRAREDGYGQNFETPNYKLDAINDILSECA
jgi:hypothetical protein